MGFPDIVRELVRRGAKVNTADNSQPTSPVSMAIRGKRKEVLKVLIELGVEIPPGLNTGLTEQEILVARWRGQHYGAAMPKAADAALDAPVYEEIEMVRCYGTDTSVLDADLIRAAREMERK
jgi:ankyrin repeat protein